jgi:ribosomal protein S18 acetylase RimI-like enzyme
VSASPIIRLADCAADYETARLLFNEYATWLAIDLCFQGFAEELATLPGAYAPPRGRLFLAEDREAAKAAGCVALRPLKSDPSSASCELKRLWVRPEFRGRGLGGALTDAALAAARDIGYTSMKLDTLPAKMPDAVAMYRAFGFEECAPYYHNPIAGSLYMTCAL